MKDGAKNMKRVTDKQCIDTGMAIVLILLLIAFWRGSSCMVKLAIPILVLNMIIPKIFYYPSIVWFRFSEVLGNLVSKIVLTLIYLIVVIPIAIIRRFFGKDTLRLKSFSKKNTDSYFLDRNHIFSGKDLENLF